MLLFALYVCLTTAVCVINISAVSCVEWHIQPGTAVILLLCAFQLSLSWFVLLVHMNTSFLNTKGDFPFTKIRDWSTLPAVSMQDMYNRAGQTTTTHDETGAVGSYKGRSVCPPVVHSTRMARVKTNLNGLVIVGVWVPGRLFL